MIPEIEPGDFVYHKTDKLKLKRFLVTATGVFTDLEGSSSQYLVLSHPDYVNGYSPASFYNRAAE